MALGNFTTTKNVNCGSALGNIWAGGGTISAWMNLSSRGPGDFGRIIDRGYAGGNGWTLASTNNDALGLAVNFSTNPGAWWTGASSAPYGSDLHLAVTYDSDSTANDAILYFNGAVESSSETFTPSGTAIDDSSTTIYLGNDSGSSYSCDGILGHIKIWNRILSAAEVAVDANGGLVGYGLISWWSLMDGAPGVSASGSGAIRDVVGGNHGTPANSPVFQEDFSKIKVAA